MIFFQKISSYQLDTYTKKEKYNSKSIFFSPFFALILWSGISTARFRFIAKSNFSDGKMNDNYQHKWAECKAFIRDNIGESRFNTWFLRTQAKSFENNVLTLDLPTHFYFEKYEDDFYQVLLAAILKVFGPDVKLNYFVRMTGEANGGAVNLPHSEKSRVIDSKLDRSTQRPANPQVQPSDKTPDFDPQLNPALNFSNYCVGESNRLAVTIAQAVAEKPRNNDFNPFFLYGDVGVGKTHLIQAIGIHVKEHNPQAKVLFTTLREFQHLYANAAMTKTIPHFINWFMQMDVLLLDDLQEIAHKTKTAEALFPIFNHLHQNGKQLVFTCDRPPMELDGIADRLIDRFKWGLTEQLPKPDASLRKAILTFKAKKNGLELPEEVIDYIASNAISSVREIEGIVMGILTRSIKLNAPINLALAKEVMKNTVRIVEPKQLNFDMIVEATAELFNLNPDVIFSKSRVQDISDARQVIMYLCNKHTNLSSTAIGRKLNRQHATILYGISSIKDRMTIEAPLAKAISDIEADLARF